MVDRIDLASAIAIRDIDRTLVDCHIMQPHSASQIITEHYAPLTKAARRHTEFCWACRGAGVVPYKPTVEGQEEMACPACSALRAALLATVGKDTE